MPGILDLSPQEQGLLQAAFAGLQASGPSRMPTTFGQVLGAAGQAGMEGMSAAKAGQLKEIQLKKAKLDLELQQALQEGAGKPGILGAGMNDPDTMEAVGTRLALAGHPGGAALVNAAEKVRAKRQADVQFKALKSSTETIAPDPQEAQQAADQGTPPVGPVTAQKGGIFSTLAGSPYVGQDARQLQGILNAAPNADPEKWIGHYERLRTAHTAAETRDQARIDRELNLSKSEHVIQDKASPTGWSYEDTRTGTKTPGAPPPASTSAAALGDIIPAAHKDLHGDDYLATLPTGMQGLVKQIAEGRQTLNAASMRYGNREAMAQRVAQYDPNYNQNRPKVWADFSQGKAAQNATAINTVIAHMGTVNNLIDAMENGNVQTVNAVVNRVRTELGKPEVNNAQIAIQAMGNEMMRVFRQVGAAQHEVEAWESKFNAAKGSPEQMKGALRVGAELVKGRLDSLQDQWKRGMNVETDFPNLVSPKSQDVLSRLGVGKATAGGWTDEKEKRFQELKRKQGGS